MLCEELGRFCSDVCKYVVLLASSSGKRCWHVLSKLLAVKRESEDRRELGHCLLGFSCTSKGYLWEGRDREDAVNASDEQGFCALSLQIQVSSATHPSPRPTRPGWQRWTKAQAVPAAAIGSTRARGVRGSGSGKGKGKGRETETALRPLVNTTSECSFSAASAHSYPVRSSGLALERKKVFGQGLGL